MKLGISDQTEKQDRDLPVNIDQVENILRIGYAIVNPPALQHAIVFGVTKKVVEINIVE